MPFEATALAQRLGDRVPSLPRHTVAKHALDLQAGELDELRVALGTDTEALNTAAKEVVTRSLLLIDREIQRRDEVRDSNAIDRIFVPLHGIAQLVREQRGSRAGVGIRPHGQQIDLGIPE